MTTAIPLAGSFRDPSGRIYRQGDRIFRTVSATAWQEFSAVSATGLLETLVEDGALVPWSEVDDVELATDEGDTARILEAEKLDFISYPYEWSFAGLKAAALLHLDIQLRALAKDAGLSDATAYNVQFKGPNPIFIDHLSFRPYRKGEFWRGHRQFCEQFLNPLLLRAILGVPHNTWFRGAMEGIPAAALSPMLPWRHRVRPKILTHVVLPARLDRAGRKLDATKMSNAVSGAEFPRASFERMLRTLRDWIAALEPKGVDGTQWSDYVHDHSYAEEEARDKREFVAEFAATLKPRLLWDIGCNTGGYTAVALGSGARKAIGFEFDAGALEKAFQRAADETLDFLPLHMDAANPSPSQGWNQCERDGLDERRNADAILALALVHHLCIGRNVPLSDVIAWLVRLAPRGVIEFVPKSDPMVVELLRFRDDIFDTYTEEHFDRMLAAHARVVKTRTVTASGRRLVWYERG